MLSANLGLHGRRRIVAETLRRTSATPTQKNLAVDSYIARQPIARLGSKLYALRAALSRRGVAPDVLETALQQSRFAKAALDASPPLDKRVLYVTPAMVQKMCQELAPLVSARTGWPLRVDRLNYQVVPAFENSETCTFATRTAAQFSPYPYPKSREDLQRGCIALSTHYMLRCTHRQMYSYVVHELVHAAQAQNHPTLLRMHHAWEYTVLKEGHAHWVQQQYLGSRCAAKPDASSAVDPALLPYWLGMQVCTALGNKPHLLELLYRQPDLMQVLLGRGLIAPDAYATRLRTAEEVRYFTQQFESYVGAMGFVKPGIQP